MGISRAGLYRLFGQESGVAAYIQRRRLDKIRAILQGDSGVQHRTSGLAFQFGFKSESHFSRSFKRAFGYSPKEARDYLIESRPYDSAGQTSVHTGFSLRTVLGQMTSG
nr:MULTISPECIES: helix-turn-helix domain-containing protein [unclassified Pseudomonas]